MVQVDDGDEGSGDGQLYWRSRRGMLELELMLVPFFREHYPRLPPELKRTYAELLDCEDWLIFDWLQGRSKPERPGMQRLVERIVGSV